MHKIQKKNERKGIVVLLVCSSNYSRELIPHTLLFVLTNTQNSECCCYPCSAIFTYREMFNYNKWNELRGMVGILCFNRWTRALHLTHSMLKYINCTHKTIAVYFMSAYWSTTKNKTKKQHHNLTNILP